MGLGGVAIAVPPCVIHPKTAVLGRAGGVPARFLKTARPWTEEQPYKDEVERCERLKKEMKLKI